MELLEKYVFNRKFILSCIVVFLAFMSFVFFKFDSVSYEHVLEVVIVAFVTGEVFSGLSIKKD